MQHDGNDRSRSRDIEVRRGRWSGAVLGAWSNSGVAAARLLSMVYGLDPTTLPTCDLVVSAGAETLAANVAYSRLKGATNIFYGSLRRFRPESFNLVLTSYASQTDRPNHAFALKPSPAANFARATRSKAPSAPPRHVALLVGGPSGETSFEPADWQRLSALVTSTATRGMIWHLTNSRRTPDLVSDQLAELAAQSGTPIAVFADVRKPDAIPLAQLLANCDAAVVTDDSSSMVSDAVAAGLPVIGLAPRLHALTTNEQAYRASLVACGWYQPVALTDIGPDQLSALFAALTPLATDPAEVLAGLLAERLPQLFPR